MPYVGNPLADAYSARVKQDLTGGSGTSFTLSHAVSSPNDLSVYINHVRQEPTTAYTVNGTALETTGTVAGTDDFYIIYDELAVQSISHPTNQALTATAGTFTSGLVGTTGTFSGALSATTGTFSGAVDIQGQELILDADNDTSITADTDDQIDFKVNSIDSFLVGQDYVRVKGVHPDLYITDTDDGSNNDAGLFYNNGVLSISADHSNVAANSAMVFFTDGTERARFNTAGNLAFAANKGIDFANASAGTGGSGGAETSTATVLDDYEEGTFAVSSNSVTGGSITEKGMYVKVGNMCTCSVRFTPSGSSTNGHQFGIYLPFKAGTTEGSGSYNTWLGSGMFPSASGNGQHRIWTLGGDSNYVDIKTQNASDTTQVTGNSMGGSFNMSFSITYQTID